MRFGATAVARRAEPKRRRREGWWAHQDLNLEPADYEPAALTFELWAREEIADCRGLKADLFGVAHLQFPINQQSAFSNQHWTGTSWCAPPGRRAVFATATGGAACAAP